MSYQVIARKYRPQRFADVVGQEHVTQTLANAVQQNRIAHAYLFCGPRGTGKTTVARIFAKCLNCTDGPKVDFPDDDPRANEITEGRSLDVIEIDGASNNGVEQVRELRETCKYAPTSGKFKIYIIDEVHMLSTAAFNALLKTLEEPPAHVKFLFATTDPEKVLATILSRCQRFDLRRIPTALIVQHLTYIAGQEKITIDAGALYAIARGADGGMRDAESTLDQLISFCGDNIVEADVLSMYGLTAQSQILGLAESILNADAENALRQLNELAKNGKDLGRLLSDLLNHFRNLLIFQISKGDTKILEVSEVEAAALATQSAMLGSETATRIMEILSDGEGRLRDAASKKILIEVTLLKAIEARNAVSIDSILKQLHQLRAESGGTVVSRPAVERSTPVTQPAARPTLKAPEPISTAPAPAPVTQVVSTPAPTAASEIVVGDLPQLWSQLVDAAGRASPFIKSYLIEAHPVSLVRNVLTIGFDPEFADHLGLVDNARNHALLQTKLRELGHPHCQVKFIKADAPANWVRPKAEVTEQVSLAPAPVTPAASPKPKTAANEAPVQPAKPKMESVPFNKDDFKNDPLIQKALEVFKGQIVDVRS